jgi:pimeloyl-ACP methyl ester carboxylesterase
MAYAVNQGVRLHYEVVGQGPPLILHIGMFGALEDWHDAGYVAALRDSYRLILVDPRGQGQSDAPHDPAVYGPEQRVGHVLAVLDSEGIERAHYWGYSLGGGVGFSLAARAPHRLISLIAGGADPYPRTDQGTHSHPWLPLLRQGMDALVTECDALDPDFFASPGERIRWLRLDALAMIAALQATPVTTGVAEVLPRLTMPSLLYRGTADNPEPAARAAQAMPSARFVPLVGLDHAQAINRSVLVLPHVLPFLEEVAAIPDP